MFRERKIVTTVSVDEVITRLYGQVRHSFISDRVDQNSFSIHKSITNSPKGVNRMFVDFLFRGTVGANNGQTEITYRVFPPIILVFLWFVQIAIVLKSAFDVLYYGGNVIILIMCLLFPAGLYGFTLWECRECVKKFEARLE